MSLGPRIEEMAHILVDVRREDARPCRSSPTGADDESGGLRTIGLTELGGVAASAQHC